MSVIQVQETDTTGTALRTYTLTTAQPAGSQSKSTTRLDLIPPAAGIDKRSVTRSTASSFIRAHIAPLFLPHGYPHSVTADYTPYQIYDSLQAFASSIAGLLSSRAVLQSLGMDSESSGSTSTATYATLLSVARSTISNLSTILFADHMSSRVSGEVKFYRFLADIMNDAGFLLEMISPSLPDYLKVPSLCLSSALRAMCGVAGGSSKAILSSHFAVDGNIGELNAKDGSQETLVNLVGMWVGGVVVSRVESFWATWCWMVALLSLHLWFNWLAVTSVRLRGLNLNRAGVIFRTLVTEGRCENVDEVGRKEQVFEKSGTVQGDDGQVVLTGRMGAGINELLKCMGSHKQAGSGSELIDSDMTHSILEVFEKERYLLWLEPVHRKAVVVLKEDASRNDQLKAWCHVVRVACQTVDVGKGDTQVLQVIAETLLVNNSAWPTFARQIEDAGWDITATTLESSPGTRLRLATSQ